MKQKTIRVTLDLNQAAYRRLTHLERLVGDNKATVLRNALQLLEYVAKRTKDGSDFRVIHRDGSEEKLVFFTMS